MINECNEEVHEIEPNEFDIETMLDEILMDETIISSELGNLREICESLVKKLDNVTSQQPGNQQEVPGKYLEIVADCQKQTAEIANAVLERHALNPAIKTVFTLTKRIRDLSEQFADLAEKQSSCPLLEPISNSISEAVKLTNDKCEYLGIREIFPLVLEDFNPQEHEIKQTTATDDRDKHRKIHQTLISGLMYRGKVLTPAKVSVYRVKN